MHLYDVEVRCRLLRELRTHHSKACDTLRMMPVLLGTLSVLGQEGHRLRAV